MLHASVLSFEWLQFMYPRAFLMDCACWQLSWRGSTYLDGRGFEAPTAFKRPRSQTSNAFGVGTTRISHHMERYATAAGWSTVTNDTKHKTQHLFQRLCHESGTLLRWSGGAIHASLSMGFFDFGLRALFAQHTRTDRVFPFCVRILWAIGLDVATEPLWWAIYPCLDDLLDSFLGLLAEHPPNSWGTSEAGRMVCRMLTWEYDWVWLSMTSMRLKASIH